MAAASNILIASGIAGMLAAVIGGGLNAFGFAFGKIVSKSRQKLLFLVGLGLLLGGLALNGDLTPRDPAKSPIPIASQPLPLANPAPSVTGASVIDFRPAMRSDNQPGYLLVSTDIAIENPVGAISALSWKRSSAVLSVEGARIPLQALYFTNINNSGVPWYGDNQQTAGPEIVAAGSITRHDLMFYPDDTGTGRYAWLTFLKAVLANPQLRPRLDIRFELEDADHRPIVLTLHCTGELPEIFDQIKRDAAKPDKQFWISAQCSK